MLKRIWRFIKDGPYAEQIASMNATTERIKASTAVIEAATQKMKENTDKLNAMAEKVEAGTEQMSEARRRVLEATARRPPVGIGTVHRVTTYDGERGSNRVNETWPSVQRPPTVTE